MQEYDILEVTDKATGEKVKIKGYKFNPSLHENPKKVGEVGKAPEGIDLSYLFDKKEEPKEIVEEVEEFRCEECDKDFKREQDLKAHTSRYHNPTKDEEPS